MKVFLWETSLQTSERVRIRKSQGVQSPRLVCRRTPPRWREVFSKETMDPELSIASAAKLTETIRVAVDTGYAVGKGVTNIGTRENQEEPRSSIPPLSADKHPCSGKR